MANRFLSELRCRVRALLHRGRVEAELDEELRFHLERHAEKLVVAGASPEEARRQARLAFGGLEAIKEEAREARGVALLESLLRDLGYAWRGLRSRKAFTIGVVLTLALGIGANATMFGIVDRLLFRPPPALREPASVHRVYLHTHEDGVASTQRNFQYASYLDLRRAARTLDTLAAFQTRELVVGDGADAVEVPVTLASASYFDLFDAPPALGRLYSASDDRAPAGAPVVVLGHAFWQARFAGRPDVLGEELRVDRVVARIIGVAPEGFVGMADQGVPAVYLPITHFAFGLRGGGYAETYNWSWLEIVARRKPGVELAAAEAELTRVFWQSWRKAEAFDAGWGAPEAVRPRGELGPVQLGRGPEAGRDTRVAALVGGVALVVLLVACANVANLLLSRSLRRRREIAMRIALGAGRGRVLRQLLVESLLLAALGGVAGLALATWAGAGLRVLFLAGAGPAPVLSDSRTLLFATVVSLAAALLTGLVPALHFRRGNLADALRAGVREEPHRRSSLSTALLVFQATLSVVLLVGAGLFVRSLHNVRGMRLGYDVEPLLFAAASTRGVELDEGQQRALLERMLAAARSLPGVTDAALVATVPFWSNEGRGLYQSSGEPVVFAGSFTLQASTPGYFATLGTRILRGRAFDQRDGEGAPPVMVVGEGMARALWPGRDSLGECLRIGSETAPCATVIGVAEDARLRSLGRVDEHAYYLPLAQFPEAAYPQVFVRFAGDAAAHVDALRRRLQAEMPGAAHVSVMPLRDLIDPNLRAWELGATMFVVFGALALMLAAIGLYGMIAYDLAQRRRELAVRLALGAAPRHLLSAIVGGALRLVALGVALGGTIALVAAPRLESLLFQESPRDPLVYAVVASALAAVALLASAAPARRALAAAPNAVLREE